MTRTASTAWTAADIPDQSGRVGIVTGANSGLGRATARELARHGAHVIMAVRDREKGQAALAALRAELPGASLELRVLDLADLDSVRDFAAEAHADRLPVDLLINNAGVMMPPRQLTPQGFESQFATNHLGHFALTGLLLGRLAERAGARVVTVSSTYHRSGRIRFDDLTGERKYSPTGFYAQSKFANVLFGLELDRRLRTAGLPVASLLAHPGYAATNLQSSGPTGVLRFLGTLGNRFMAQGASAGALPQLFAATDPRAESGQFIGPDGRGGLRGHPAVVQPVESARDPETARRLWELSEQLTGVRYDFTVPAGR